MSATSDAQAALLSLGLEAWVAKTSALLSLEQDAGVSAASEALSRQSESERVSQGVSLRLVVDGVSTGLMGRSVLTLAPRNGLLLPTHSFSTGDIVGIVRMGTVIPPGSSRDAYDTSAVVVTVLKNALTVAVDESRGTSEGAVATGTAGDPLCAGDAVRMDKLADDVSFRRLSYVLDDLREYRHGAAGKVIRCLFGTESDLSSGLCIPEFAAGPTLQEKSRISVGGAPSIEPNPFLSSWAPLNQGLNPSQTRAIESALRASDLCMIHGPPGTGKTTAVVEYILQEVLRGNRVLACAPSNVAVDNMVERLVSLPIPTTVDGSRKRGVSSGQQRSLKLCASDTPLVLPRASSRISGSPGARCRGHGYRRGCAS